jgi:hypothetical protein
MSITRRGGLDEHIETSDAASMRPSLGILFCRCGRALLLPRLTRFAPALVLSCLVVHGFADPAACGVADRGDPTAFVVGS